MKKQFQMYQTPIVAMLTITAIGSMAVILAAFKPSEAPEAIAIATLFTVAICAIATVSYAYETALRGADHISDAVARARAAGADPVMQWVTYPPCLYARKGREPWVGFLVWRTETTTVSVPVYGHGARDYEGLTFAKHDPVAAE